MYLYYLRKYLSDPESYSANKDRFKDDKKAVEQSSILFEPGSIYMDETYTRDPGENIKKSIGIDKSLYTNYDYAYTRQEFQDYFDSEYMKWHPNVKKLPPKNVTFIGDRIHNYKIDREKILPYRETPLFLCEVKDEKDAICEATKFMLANDMWLRYTNIYTIKVSYSEYCLFINYFDSEHSIGFLLFKERKELLYYTLYPQRVWLNTSEYLREVPEAEEMYIPKGPDQFMRNYYASKTYLSKYFKNKREPERLTDIKYLGLK